MLQWKVNISNKAFRLKFCDSQAAVEEGIVVGGGCTLLRLASKVDAIKASLENEEEKVIFCFWLLHLTCLPTKYVLFGWLLNGVKGLHF